MVIYSIVRYKILYISLFTIIAALFIISCFLITWEYSASIEYWNSINLCKATKDFDCLLNVKSSRQVFKDFCFTLLANILIVNGIALSIALQTLFKISGLGKEND